MCSENHQSVFARLIQLSPHRANRLVDVTAKRHIIQVTIDVIAHKHNNIMMPIVIFIVITVDITIVHVTETTWLSKCQWILCSLAIRSHISHESSTWDDRNVPTSGMCMSRNSIWHYILNKQWINNKYGGGVGGVRGVDGVCINGGGDDVDVVGGVMLVVLVLVA